MPTVCEDGAGLLSYLSYSALSLEPYVVRLDKLT